MNARPLILLAITLLAGSAHAEDAPPPGTDPPMRSRAFVVEHLPAFEANAILRSLVNLRKTAIEPQRNQILVRDTEDQLAEAARILEMIDQPQPKWTALIVAETASGDDEVRTLQLVGKATWRSGTPPLHDNLAISIDPHPVGADLVADVSLSVAAGGDQGRQDLTRDESQRVLLHDGDSMDLLRATTPATQQALQRLTGSSSPVRALRLEISRETAPARSKRR